MREQSGVAMLRDILGRVRPVRRALVTLSLLRVGALWLTLVAAYLGGYALLDHYVRFGAAARVVALGVLVVGSAAGLVALARALLGHVSCSRAAAHVESRMDFGRELVTAVEFAEAGRDYPYSRSLAESVVERVHRASRDVDLRRSVPRWQGYALAALMAVVLVASGLLVRDHYRFFATYLSRLMHPAGGAEALPLTTITSLSGDVVSEPDSRIELEARVEGRVPASVSVLVEAAGEQVLVADAPAAAGDPRLRAAGFPLERGDYRYRFESAPAASDWHAIRVRTRPAIREIQARVTPAVAFVRPYVETVSDLTLAVLPGSQVQLTVQATEPLSSASVALWDGAPAGTELDGASAFEFTFVADHEGAVRFGLVSDTGVPAGELPPLQVKMRSNEPPTFSLLSPGGDYRASAVASVPVRFEVSDDFGLEAARLHFEMSDGRHEVVPALIERGEGTAALERTLELEDLDLQVGDSILFYAEAEDLEVPGTDRAKGPVRSGIFFIEVMPNEVSWYPGSPPGSPPTGPSPSRRLYDNLVYVLEYTRAILSKTWDIAGSGRLGDAERDRLDSIASDVDYTAAQLAGARGNAAYGWTPEQLVAIDSILEDYDRSAGHLTAHRPQQAIPPEKEAYQELRKLVDESAKKLCPPGSPPPPRPDRLVVEEQAHVRRFDPEVVLRELERAQTRLEAMQAEQERLQQEFDHFMADRPPVGGPPQRTTDERSWPEQDGDAGPAATAAPAPGGTQPNLPGRGVTVEGALPGGYAASAAERLSMLRARERALREEARRLGDVLGRAAVEPGSDPASRAARDAAQMLASAERAMERFDEAAASAGFNARQSDELLTRAAESLSEAGRELARAQAAIGARLAAARREGEGLPQQLLAEAQSLSALAEEAKRDPARVAELTAALARAEARAQGLTPNGAGANPRGDIGGSGTGAPAGFELPKEYRDLPPTEKARLLAERLRSLALLLGRQQGALAEDEASDADLYDLETRFYENAARFKGQEGGR